MAVITGTDSAEELDGLVDDDTIYGLDGDDTILGNGGADSITGDGGNDTISVASNSGVDSVDGGSGNDSIAAFGAAGDTVLGGAGDDFIEAWAFTSGMLDGGSDNDTLIAYAADISGLTISNVEVLETSSGTLSMTCRQVSLFQSIVDFQDPTSFVVVTLTDGGSVDFSGSAPQGIHLHLHSSGDTVTTGNGDDIVDGYGGQGPSTITAGGGNDFVSVSYGNDSIDAGSGDDTINALHSTGDSVDGGLGNDLIYASTGTAFPISGAVDGGLDVDTLYAYGSGTDLSGLTISGIEVLQNLDSDGAVSMRAGQAGLFGAIVDFYDPSQPVSVNLTDRGTADFTLNTSQGVDLTLCGLGDNVRTGAGVDTVAGGAGNDTIEAGAGGDQIDGGGGVNVLSFSQSNAAVTVSLADGAGTVGDAAGDAIANIQNLMGSGLADGLTGDGNPNVLDGSTSADTLTGFGGNDTYRVDNPADVAIEAAGEGSDTIFASVSYGLGAGQSIDLMATSSRGATSAMNLTGNDLAQRIDGNYGDNILIGGGGGDTLYGFFGSDAFHVSGVADKVYEAVGQGSDTVFASVSYTLLGSQSVEVLTAETPAGTDALVLTGNAYAQLVGGNAGNNVIDGRGGGDTLYGYGGNDSYRVATGADRVYEASGEGSDTVFAASSYALLIGQSVDCLATLSRAGVGAINLTGNELAQRIDGNYGNNSLTGGGGGDTLYGFLGDDRFYVSTATDRVYESAGQGSDTVFASGSYALPAGQSIEYLSTTTRTGTTSIVFNGNEQAQRIDGNYGVNGLYGGDGNDTIYGFDSDDTLSGGNGRDLIDGGSGNDVFLYTAASQTTGANHDLIQNINFAQDDIDLPVLPTGIDAKITIGSLSDASFDGDLSGVVNAGRLPAHHAVLFDPNAGTANIAGHMFLIVDANGVAGYQAGHDFVIELLNATGTLGLGDFI